MTLQDIQEVPRRSEESIMNKLQKVNEVLKGGSGSGDWGHTGRAGRHGGSGGGGGKGRPRKGRRSREALDKEIEANKKPVFPSFPAVPKGPPFGGPPFGGPPSGGPPFGGPPFGGPPSFAGSKGSPVFKLTPQQSRTIRNKKPVQQFEPIQQKKPNITGSKVTDNTRNSDKDKNIDRLHSNFDANKANMSIANRDTIDNLSKKTGVNSATVKAYLTDWNGDDKLKRFQITESIHRTLGMEMSPYEAANNSKWIADGDAAGVRAPAYDDAYDRITKAIYDDTQKQLKELGSSEVLLYRGMSQNEPAISKGDTVNWHGNTIDSWTTDQGVAERFIGGENGFALKSTIPANRIFSMSSSGIGTSNEREMVVLGNGPNDNVLISDKNN